MILLFNQDFCCDQTVRLSDRRSEHIIQVLKACEGSKLEVGLYKGNKGIGEITRITNSELDLKVTLNKPPPPPLPLSIILALPRPRMLRRILISLTTLGIKKVFIINSYRVEKSYWQSPELKNKKIDHFINLGLEQAKDTIPPEIEFYKSFKKFGEKALPKLINANLGFIAQPGSNNSCPFNISQPATLAVGPEGGFIEYEVDKFKEEGFIPIDLGERILTVETAIPVLTAKLFKF